MLADRHGDKALFDIAVQAAWVDAFVAAGNPRVGCVITDETGTIIATGAHLGGGTPHAEVVALQQAGAAARGAHVYVTLEPCRHSGRTPPCTDALIAAQIASVTYAVADPGQVSGGGARVLTEAGISVHQVEHAGAEHLTRTWRHVQHHDRPYIIGKCAMSLDGRVAQASGAPWPLTSAATNHQAHDLRASVDAIVVGTATVLIDDPALSARDASGDLHPIQPRVYVVGERALPANAQVHSRNLRHIASRSIPDAMAIMRADGIETVLLEGGPTLLGAWIAAGVVDELRWSISPVVIGAGPRAASGIPSPPMLVRPDPIAIMEQDIVIGAIPNPRA